MNFKLKKSNIKEYEIKPGIIASKLDLKDSDTIIITIDEDMYDLDTIYEVHNMVNREFPNNKVLTIFKGIEINAADGPSPI